MTIIRIRIKSKMGKTRPNTTIKTKASTISAIELIKIRVMIKVRKDFKKQRIKDKVINLTKNSTKVRTKITLKINQKQQVQAHTKYTDVVS